MILVWWVVPLSCPPGTICNVLMEIDSKLDVFQSTALLLRYTTSCLLPLSHHFQTVPDLLYVDNGWRYRPHVSALSVHTQCLISDENDKPTRSRRSYLLEPIHPHRQPSLQSFLRRYRIVDIDHLTLSTGRIANPILDMIITDDQDATELRSCFPWQTFPMSFLRICNFYLQ